MRTPQPTTASSVAAAAPPVTGTGSAEVHQASARARDLGASGVRR